MKRSEMIRQIGRELRAQSSGNCDINPDQLLAVIEAAGMLPPPSSVEAMHDTLTYAWYDFDDKNIDCEEFKYWESEND